MEQAGLSPVDANGRARPGDTLLPLLFIFRFLFGLLSLLILGAAAYLLWSYNQGELVRDVDGVLRRDREEWRLWTGLALLAWSFLGRLVALPLLARSDKVPTRPERSNGQTLPGAGGSSLYVETHGPADAPPLILTHGWGLDSTIWSYAKRDLAGRFRLIVWDLAGLGRSKGPISLDAFAADLRAVLSVTAGRPAVLVGHSIGGMTIQTLARNNPELFGREVAGVVLLNTTYTNPLKTMVLSGLAQAIRPLLEIAMRLAVWLQPLAWASAWQSYFSGSAHMANRLGFGRYVTRSQLEHTTLLATRNPPGAQAKGDLAMFRWDASEAARRFTVPTLVIGGDKDIVTKLEANRTIADRAPQARLEVVEGVNHMGFLERADVYDALIGEFAGSVLTGGGQGVPAAAYEKARR